MKLAEDKMKLAQDIASLINNSLLPPTVIRMVLADIDRMVAQLEETQYQKALSANAEKGDNNA